MLSGEYSCGWNTAWSLSPNAASDYEKVLSKVVLYRYTSLQLRLGIAGDMPDDVARRRVD